MIMPENKEANENKKSSMEKADKGYESSESQQQVLRINGHEIEPCLHPHLDEHCSFTTKLDVIRILEEHYFGRYGSIKYCNGVDVFLSHPDIN